MGIVAVEGVVDQGVVRLPADTALPDGTKVYVIVPSAAREPKARIASPRLAHPEEAIDFQLEVVEP